MIFYFPVSNINNWRGHTSAYPDYQFYEQSGIGCLWPSITSIGIRKTDKFSSGYLKERTTLRTSISVCSILNLSSEFPRYCTNCSVRPLHYIKDNIRPAPYWFQSVGVHLPVLKCGRSHTNPGKECFKTPVIRLGPYLQYRLAHVAIVRCLNKIC